MLEEELKGAALLLYHFSNLCKGSLSARNKVLFRLDLRFQLTYVMTHEQYGKWCVLYVMSTVNTEKRIKSAVLYNPIKCIL